MAEPPASTASWPDVGEADVLLATKLYVPRLPPGFVFRPRLAARLEEGLARGLLLVCAPAGFGKTSLLADWARSSQRPVAWLSLDPGDNDPARFWRHVVAAVDRVAPEAAQRVRPLLGPPTPPSFEGLVTALINELAVRSDDAEVVLVLDDYHLIEAQPVHEPVGFLLEHLPPCLHLVVASRADPPLPVARLRARGQLVELRTDQLRFTATEATAVLREAAGPDLPLPEDAAAALAARTEGWVAGLQLAGLSLHGWGDVAGFVASFSGSHRYVLDFFAEEVLDRQSDQVRAFLLETSVLERLSGELCDAVTGRSGSQRLLEQMERANLFLVPLDEVRGWWRYHHLFADLLRVRLREEQPDQAAKLHRNAAAWYERRGMADDAVRHAAAAGEMTWTARLIERHADATLLSGEQATVQRWLSMLADDLVRSRPRLCLAQAWMALDSSDGDAAEDPVNAAELRFANAGDEPFEPSADRGASLLANVPAAIALARAFIASLRGDAEATAAYASRALAGLSESEWLLEFVTRWHIAVAEWLRGHLAEAERGFADRVAGWHAAGARGMAASGCHFLGQVQRAQGRLDAALGTYQHAFEITAPPGQSALPAVGVAHVGMAEVAYQQGDLDAALRYVAEGIPQCRRFNYTQPLATGLATLAWIRQAQGDPAGALDAIGEADRVAPGPEVTNLLNPVPAQRARLLLAQGDIAAATRWTKERSLGADDEVSYQREREYLVLVRVLLALNRPDDAARLLERLHAAAADQGRTGSLIEIQALRALGLADSGEEPAAVAVLADALTLGRPQGYVRIFTDEGPSMAALLGRLIATQKADQSPARDIPLGYLGRVARSFEQDAAGTGRSATQIPPVACGLAEPMTEREWEILRLLAAGMPNREIAAELVVSLHTVKKHVTHVLGKLGAANRTEATARARELGLLP